jgi:hypothetical protein
MKLARHVIFMGRREVLPGFWRGNLKDTSTWKTLAKIRGEYGYGCINI